MSLLKTNSVQIGQSATATQNFTLSVPSSPDGTIKLARGNNGATTQDVLAVNASGQITATITGSTITGSTISGGCMTLGTAVAPTGSTSIDFTGIPSWVKRITVMFNSVSTTGTATLLVQLGTSSGFVATGYLGSTGYSSNGGTAVVSNNSTGFRLDNFTFAADIRHGNATISLIGSNTWSFNSAIGLSGGAASSVACGGGSIPLGGTLDRIRITADGTQTFDSGLVNILYEG